MKSQKNSEIKRSEGRKKREKSFDLNKSKGSFDFLKKKKSLDLTKKSKRDQGKEHIFRSKHVKQPVSDHKNK